MAIPPNSMAIHSWLSFSCFMSCMRCERFLSLSLKRMNFSASGLNKASPFPVPTQMFPLRSLHMLPTSLEGKLLASLGSWVKFLIVFSLVDKILNPFSAWPT